MKLEDQIKNETDAIIELADNLTEKQLLASIIYEIKKVRRAVKLVETELSVIKLKLR